MPLRLDMVRLRSSDPVASHSFYRQAFALNDANATDAADTPLNIHGKGQLHIVPGEETPPASPTFDGYVLGAILQQPTDVDQLLGAAHQQGARMIKPAKKQFFGTTPPPSTPRRERSGKSPRPPRRTPPPGRPRPSRMSCWSCWGLSSPSRPPPSTNSWECLPATITGTSSLTSSSPRAVSGWGCCRARGWPRTSGPTTRARAMTVPGTLPSCGVPGRTAGTAGHGTSRRSRERSGTAPAGRPMACRL